MKNSKKLELILKILVCILIILIGTVGIYTKENNMYNNLLPEYTLGSDIKGSTILELEVDDTKNTVYYDKDGNEVASSEVTDKNKDDYTKEEIPVNAEEDLNLENYKEIKKIMDKRLMLLGVDQYQLDLNEDNGKIILSVEDNYIEDIESILPMVAKLQLIDSNTEDVIIDYTDFESAESTYIQLTREYRTYITLKLKDSGIEKIKDIDKYKVVETVKDSEGNEKKQESKLIVNFDSQKIAEVSYDDIVLNGKTLRVTTAKGITSDSELSSQYNLDAIASRLATIGKMPIKYNLIAEEFIKNDSKIDIVYITMALIAICAILSIILVISHKFKGLLGVIGLLTNISLFLIMIRLTKVPVSLNGFAGIIGLIAFNYILINNILKFIKDKEKTFSENVKRAYLKTLDIIVFVLIIFIVFSFSEMTVINSMGLLLFWGWIIAVFATLIFTVPMLSTVDKK